MKDIETIASVYNRVGSIRKTAAITELSFGTVRKALISAGVYKSDRAVQIEALLRQGLTPSEIAERLHISRTTVDVHSPYVKGMYRSDSPTENALRIRSCRTRKKAKKEADA